MTTPWTQTWRSCVCRAPWRAPRRSRCSPSTTEPSHPVRWQRSPAGGTPSRTTLARHPRGCTRCSCRCSRWRSATRRSGCTGTRSLRGCCARATSRAATRIRVRATRAALSSCRAPRRCLRSPWASRAGATAARGMASPACTQGFRTTARGSRTWWACRRLRRPPRLPRRPRPRRPRHRRRCPRRLRLPSRRRRLRRHLRRRPQHRLRRHLRCYHSRPRARAPTRATPAALPSTLRAVPTTTAKASRHGATSSPPTRARRPQPP